MFSPARFHSKIKPAGNSLALNCPACGKAVEMPIFNSFELFKIMEIPVHSFNSRYFTVCPQCAAVFELAQSAVKAFENGNPAFLAQQLTPVQPGKRPAAGGTDR